MPNEPTSGRAAALSVPARAYIAASLKPNTRRAYAAQLKQWLAWRGAAELEPAEPIDVANFLAERAQSGRTIATLRTALAAIKAGHEAHGWCFNCQAPEIARVMRGIANSTARPPRQAEPLAGSELVALLRAMTSGKPSPIDLRDAALLAVGYTFALRRSELVGLDYGAPSRSPGKGTGVLRLTPTTLEVSLAQSKFSDGRPQHIAVLREDNTATVAAVRAWVDWADLDFGQPVFWSLSKSGRRRSRLSGQSVSLIVKARVARQTAPPGASLRFRGPVADPHGYSGHSLRVGFAVTAAECGADIRAIAAILRHRSLAMAARYAQRAEQLRTGPHRIAGVGLKTIGCD